MDSLREITGKWVGVIKLKITVGWVEG